MFRDRDALLDAICRSMLIPKGNECFGMPAAYFRVLEVRSWLVIPVTKYYQASDLRTIYRAGRIRNTGYE